MFVFPFKRIPKIENDFGKLFPKIAALALELPDQVKKVTVDVIQVILFMYEVYKNLKTLKILKWFSLLYKTHLDV